MGKELAAIVYHLQKIDKKQIEIRLRIDEIGYGDNVGNNVEMIRDRTTEIGDEILAIGDILMQLGAKEDSDG